MAVRPPFFFRVISGQPRDERVPEGVEVGHAVRGVAVGNAGGLEVLPQHSGEGHLLAPFPDAL